MYTSLRLVCISFVLLLAFVLLSSVSSLLISPRLLVPDCCLPLLRISCLWPVLLTFLLISLWLLLVSLLLLSDWGCCCCRRFNCRCLATAVSCTSFVVRCFDIIAPTFSMAAVVCYFAFAESLTIFVSQPARISRPFCQQRTLSRCGGGFFPERSKGCWKDQEIMTCDMLVA